MQLLAPLASGIRGAENGTVEIFVRGTAALASYYTDFEATSIVLPTTGVDLDANGRLEAYVNQVVDCRCKDSDGNVVLTFTAGESAENVEYQGVSFTGTDYETAATGTGSGFPVMLQAILDRWLTSAGAPDWEVLLGGSAVGLSVLASALDGLVFNVQSETYGALGDGATDDTAAIQACIDAANAVEGIVFFPPGTYVTSSALLPKKASLVGASAIVNLNHASANVLTYSTAHGDRQRLLYGLTLTPTQNNSGTIVSLAATTNLAVSGCVFGNGLSNQGDAIVCSSGSVTLSVSGSVFRAGGSASRVFHGSTKPTRARFDSCLFVTFATYAPTGGMVYSDAVDISRCIFSGTGSTSGTFSYYAAKTTTLDARIRDCNFLATTSATPTAMTLGSYSATSVFEESGNTFGSDVTAYSYLSLHAGNSVGALVRLRSRDGRIYRVTSNVSPLNDLPFHQYGTVVVSRSSSADQIISLMSMSDGANVPPDGSITHLVVLNDSTTITTERFDLDETGTLTVLTHSSFANARLIAFPFQTLIKNGTVVNVVPWQAADIETLYL